MTFRDPESAQGALNRIKLLSSDSVASRIESGLAATSDPDQALTNLERWLGATGSPGLYAEKLAYMKEGSPLLELLAVSQPIANILIQNPELSSLLFEPRQLARIPAVESLFAEGAELLASATSFTHSLDRLRFLKQRWYFGITINDLAETWEQQTVWRALSDLADALIVLAFGLVWKEVAKTRSLPAESPVMVVGFGKLGGQELNYSSDVDLAYVLEDGLDERTERECARFCQAFGRALSDRMGRGNLFRVDLRLRPYGAAGSIVASMKGVESYYTRWAAPWEIQALLRSRPIIGPAHLTERWENLRIAHCFKPKLTEIALDEIFSMRARIEEHAAQEDIKRGAGGIRDVEFLVQALQLVHGYSIAALRDRNTLNDLATLRGAGLLSRDVADALVEGYTFLRKLEHRLQLVGDLQTHEIPSSPSAREALARTMGHASWQDLECRLTTVRSKIGDLYRSTLHSDSLADNSRSRVLRGMGSLGPALAQWFDALDEHESFYAGLEENEGSLSRTRKILEFAPNLIESLRQSLSLTEQILSGEIEESADVSHRVEGLSDPTDVSAAARVYRESSTKLMAHWILSPDHRPEGQLSALAERLLDKSVGWFAPGVTVIALGSFANREMSLGSDLDLLLLAEDAETRSRAEEGVQRLLSWFGKVHQHGARLQVDLRLRPDGRKGLLVRTLQGLEAYAGADLELWERFALGHARLIRGSRRALEVVNGMAYGVSVNGAHMAELLDMKHRVETERVKPQHVRRNVKLGHGGLNDIEWLVHLHEMKYPEATEARLAGAFPERIRRLNRAELINALECEFLLAAHEHLLDVRLRLQLLGFEDDLVPENPDKLDRLARSCGDVDGNSFLGRHEPIIDGVRRLYHESLERLLK